MASGISDNENLQYINIILFMHVSPITVSMLMLSILQLSFLYLEIGWLLLGIIQCEKCLRNKEQVIILNK